MHSKPTRGRNAIYNFVDQYDILLQYCFQNLIGTFSSHQSIKTKKSILCKSSIFEKQLNTYFWSIYYDNLYLLYGVVICTLEFVSLLPHVFALKVGI